MGELTVQTQAPRPPAPKTRTTRAVTSRRNDGNGEADEANLERGYDGGGTRADMKGGAGLEGRLGGMAVGRRPAGDHEPDRGVGEESSGHSSTVGFFPRTS